MPPSAPVETTTGTSLDSWRSTGDPGMGSLSAEPARHSVPLQHGPPALAQGEHRHGDAHLDLARARRTATPTRRPPARRRSARGIRGEWKSSPAPSGDGNPRSDQPPSLQRNARRLPKLPGDAASEKASSGAPSPESARSGSLTPASSTSGKEHLAPAGGAEDQHPELVSGRQHQAYVSIGPLLQRDAAELGRGNRQGEKLPRAPVERPGLEREGAHRRAGPGVAEGEHRPACPVGGETHEEGRGVGEPVGGAGDGSAQRLPRSSRTTARRAARSRRRPGTRSAPRRRPAARRSRRAPSPGRPAPRARAATRAVATSRTSPRPERRRPGGPRPVARRPVGPRPVARRPAGPRPVSRHRADRHPGAPRLDPRPHRRRPGA